MTPEIDQPAFTAAHADGAFVLDVREPQEYVEGHVPGARLVPLAQVLNRQCELSVKQPVYVICASGNRSKTATDWLRRKGFDAFSVTGGTRAWVSGGRPVVRATRATA